MPEWRGRKAPKNGTFKIKRHSTGNTIKKETAVSLRLVNFVLYMYKQLNSEQRYEISALISVNTPVKVIAEKIGCHISTVYRELSRNSCKDGHYSAKVAKEMAKERHERIVRNSALKPGVLKKAIDLLVTEQWSPRQISGYLALKGHKISHERLYQEIRADSSGELAKHTRHGLKHRSRTLYNTARACNIPNRTSIHDRPPEANGLRFGDWEMDLIVDPKQNAILTLTERKTNFILMEKLPQGKMAKPLAKVVVRLLSAWRNGGVKTITTDNGSEFAAHEHITKWLRRKSLPDVKVYFTDPYSSWQKGAIENANGLIRQYIPKGMSFDLISDEEILEIQYKLNRRPRQKLGFSTPIAELNKLFS